MKIAVPVTKSNQLDVHFGHCEYYQVFTVDGKEISHVETIPSTQGCGCKSNIASVLADSGVSLMLAGGIGMGAVQVLNRHGIEVIKGCGGIPEDNVKLYLTGNLVDQGSVCQSHASHSGNPDHTCQH